MNGGYSLEHLQLISKRLYNWRKWHSCPPHEIISPSGKREALWAYPPAWMKCKWRESCRGPEQIIAGAINLWLQQPYHIQNSSSFDSLLFHSPFRQCTPSHKESKIDVLLKVKYTAVKNSQNLNQLYVT